MKANVKWIGDKLFLGTSQSGHSVLLDANGGNQAPCPLENLLISLGSCSSVEVVSVLQKTRQNIRDCSVEISGTCEDNIPKLFSSIHLHFVITGSDVKAKHVKRAVTIAADKYCSVALMLNANVEITHNFSIKAE